MKVAQEGRVPHDFSRSNKEKFDFCIKTILQECGEDSFPWLWTISSDRWWCLEIWRPGPAWAPSSAGGVLFPEQAETLRRDLYLSVQSCHPQNVPAQAQKTLVPLKAEITHDGPWLLLFTQKLLCSDPKRRIRGFFLHCPYFESHSVIEFVWFISGGEASVGYSLFCYGLFWNIWL